MKNSERNLMVLQNFILHITTSSEGDFDSNTSQLWTANELYQAAQDYIEEDHVDGKGNPEDNNLRFQVENISFKGEDDYDDYLKVKFEIKGKRFESLAFYKTADLTKLGFKK